MKHPSTAKSHSHRVQKRRIRITDQSARGTKTINITVDKTTGERSVATSTTTQSTGGKIAPQVATSIKTDIGKAQ